VPAPTTLIEKLIHIFTFIGVKVVSWMFRRLPNEVGLLAPRRCRPWPRRGRRARLTRSRFVLVHVWRARVLTWSAGHVMITEDDATFGREPTVILSQFPHPPGGRSRPRGMNVRFAFRETLRDLGRGVDFVFRVRIPDGAAFDAEAAKHRSRPRWDCHPSRRDETHCARAAYDALKAGGVPLRGADSGQVFPWTFGKLLQHLSATSRLAIELQSPPVARPTAPASRLDRTFVRPLSRDRAWRSMTPV
jgi:hypothetical protein